MTQVATNQQRVAYNTAIQVIGRAVTGILGLVAISLSTRYLGLNHYGQLTTALIFVGLFSAICDAGTATIAVRELVQSQRKPASVVGNVLILRTLLGLAAVVLTLVLGQLIYPGSGSQPIRLAIDLLSLTLLLTTIQDAVTATLVARLRNDLLVIGDIIGRLVSLAAIILVIHQHWGFVGLIWATLAGVMANFVSDCLCGIFYIKPDLHPDPAYMKRVLWLSAPIGAGVILNSIYFKADGFLLSLFKGSASVGLYGVAYKLVELTMAFPIFFTAAVFPLTSAAAHDVKRLNEITARAARILNVTSAPIIVGSIVLAAPLIKILGGQAFAAAALPMEILMLANYFVYNSTVYSGPLIARNLQSKTLKVIAVVLTVNVLVNLVAIPRAGTVGAAWVVVLSEIVTLILLRYYYRRYISQPPSLLSNLPVLGCAAVMGLVVWLVKQATPNLPAASSLGLLLLVGALAYTALIFGTKLYSVQELKSLFQRQV